MRSLAIGHLYPLAGLIIAALTGQILFANDLAVAALGLLGLVFGARLAGRLHVRQAIPMSPQPEFNFPFPSCKERQ